MGINSWRIELKRNIANIKQYQADKAVREEKIRRLEKAHKEIHDARCSFKGIQKNVESAASEMLNWRGNTQQTYLREHATYIKATYSGADSKIGEILEQIRREINKLKEQNNDFVQMIKGLERRNRNLNNWIADALRDDD